MSLVLVDSSVWVRMFREAASPETQELGRLLRAGLVCTHGLIRAEILSGARSESEYRGLERGFSALPSIPDPPGLWDRVAHIRYRLARRGFQAGIADLVVAVAASYYSKTLFSLDRAFPRIRQVLPFKLFRTTRH